MSLLTILNIAPEDEIKETLKFYYHLNLNDPEIARQMKDHYDTQKYGLRYDSDKGVTAKESKISRWLVSPAKRALKKI